MKYSLLLFSFFFLSCNSSEEKNTTTTTANSDEEWTLTPFQKQDQVNPIMIRDSSLVFTCPILKQPVQWARKDVFNPAAVIRNDTVFLIFRAEDTIGKHA